MLSAGIRGHYEPQPLEKEAEALSAGGSRSPQQCSVGENPNGPSESQEPSELPKGLKWRHLSWTLILDLLGARPSVVGPQ